MLIGVPHIGGYIRQHQRVSYLDTFVPQFPTNHLTRFLKKPDYDIDVAEYADANKQPIAVSELLTANALGLRPLAFKGVAMVIAGQYDFIFCQSK